MLRSEARGFMGDHIPVSRGALVVCRLWLNEQVVELERGFLS